MKQTTLDDVELLLKSAEKSFKPAKLNSDLKFILFMSGFALLVPYFAMFVGAYELFPYYDMYLSVNTIIYIVQIALLIFYSMKNNFILYQNSHLLFFTFSSFKVSIDAYLFLYYYALVSDAPNWFIHSAIFIQLLGIVLLFILTKRAKLLVYDGAFRNGGKGILAKRLNWLQIIIILFILILFAIFIFFILSYGILVIDEIFGVERGIWGAWIACFIFQYLILLLIPYSYLIYSCKRKFSEFKF